MQFQAGDYYKITHPTLMVGAERFAVPPVYGRITGNDELAEGMFWVEAFSMLCPEGERGTIDTEREPVQPISHAEFVIARMVGWMHIGE